MLGQRREDPLIEIGVRILVRISRDERLGSVDGVCDAVAALHEHRTAAGHATHWRNPVLVHARLVDLIGVGLVTAEHDGAVVPLPEAQRRAALAGGHLVKQQLVECDVDRRGQHARLQDFPLVVREIRAVGQRALHRHRKVVRAKPVQGHRLLNARQGGVETALNIRGRLAAVRAHERRRERLVGVLGLKKEIARDLRRGDGTSLVDRDIDDDELAARDFEFKMLIRFSHKQERTRV